MPMAVVHLSLAITSRLMVGVVGLGITILLVEVEVVAAAARLLGLMRLGQGRLAALLLLQVVQMVIQQQMTLGRVAGGLLFWAVLAAAMVP